MQGEGMEGNPPIVGPLSHTLWLSSTVFDGARAFQGVAPDLDLHCARAIRSAQVMGLEPMVTAGEIEELCWDGIRRFPGRILGQCIVNPGYGKEALEDADDLIADLERGLATIPA